MRPSLPLLAIALIPSAALADHAGPSGVGGGSINVLSPDTLPRGEVAVGLRLNLAVPRRRSDAELASLAGQHVHAHNVDYVLQGSAGFAFGLTERLTVSVELPYVRRDDLREGTHSHVGGTAVNGAEALGTAAGIGDASALARYRLTAGRAGSWTLIAGIKTPTGGTHASSRAGERLETEHQAGTGSWDPILGAAVAAAAGQVRVTASALYQVSGRGAQRTKLGDRAQAGIAVSHRFGPPEHHHEEPDEGHETGEHGHGDEHAHASWDAFVELAGEWEGRQRIDGDVERASGGTSLWLVPGGRFNASGGYSVALGLGLPLWQHIRRSHPKNAYRLSLSVGRTF